MPTNGAVQVNDVSAKVSPMSSVDVGPPAVRLLASTRVSSALGSRMLIQPNNPNAKTTNNTVMAMLSQGSAASRLSPVAPKTAVAANPSPVNAATIPSA